MHYDRRETIQRVIVLCSVQPRNFLNLAFLDIIKHCIYLPQLYSKNNDASYETSKEKLQKQPLQIQYMYVVFGLNAQYLRH